MPKTYKIHRVIDRNIIILNHLEIFYLRLYIHNLNTLEISQFLEIDVPKVNRIRASIYKKYKTKNWTKIIAKAFMQNHLMKKDFIDESLKTDILKQTKLVYEKCIQRNDLDYSIEDLRRDLTRYYIDVEVKLVEEYNRMEDDKKLTENELVIIELKFNGFTNEIICDELGISESRLTQYSGDIYQKLKVTNWFNVYKKCLYYNLLKIDNAAEIIKIEVHKSASRMFKLKYLTRLEQNEKKLTVYTNLIELYSNIEFGQLLSRDSKL